MLYVVRVVRIVKVGTGSTAKYAPRTTNHEYVHMIGPFKSRGRAERALLSTLGTHTFLGGAIYSESRVASELENQHRLHGYEVDFLNACRKAFVDANAESAATA